MNRSRNKYAVMGAIYGGCIAPVVASLLDVTTWPTGLAVGFVGGAAGGLLYALLKKR